MAKHMSKRKKEIEILVENQRELRGSIEHLQRQLRSAGDELRVARIELQARAEIPRMYLRVTDSRGSAQYTYEGATAESFKQWAGEILYPVLVKDLRELGQSAQIRLNGSLVLPEP